MAFIEFVRVRDKATGHEYDVVASAVDGAAHEVLTDYPPNVTGVARPAKHRAHKKATTSAAVSPKEE
jgi:hypothetical protein